MGNNFKECHVTHFISLCSKNSFLSVQQADLLQISKTGGINDIGRMKMMCKVNVEFLVLKVWSRYFQALLMVSTKFIVWLISTKKDPF